MSDPSQPNGGDQRLAEMLLNAQAERDGRNAKRGGLVVVAVFLLLVGAPLVAPALAIAFLAFDLGWDRHIRWAQRQVSVSARRYRLLLAHSILNSSVFAAFTIYVSRLEWEYAPIAAVMLLIAQAFSHMAYESNGRDEMIWSIVLFSVVAQILMLAFHPLDATVFDILFLHGSTLLLSAFASAAGYQSYRIKSALRLVRADLASSERENAAGRLASNLAHEFRDLLTVMRGNVDLVPVVEPEARPIILSEIRKATERGERLVSRLMLIGHGSGRDVREVELGDRLDRFVRFAERVLPRNISLRMSEPPHDLNLRLDVTQLEAALLEIVLDARDAMPEGGAITFSVERKTAIDGTGATGIVVTVADSGRVGDHPDGNTRNRPALRAFVEASEGRLDIRRSQWGGTTVVMTLPA
jgi:signal transduction histidine kinase